MECLDNVLVQKIAVTATLLVAVVSNFASSGVGRVSQDNPTWLTPDGQTFAIWAVVYTQLLVLVGAQWCPDAEAEELLSQRCPLTKLQVRWRITLYLAMNALWLPLFVRSYFFLSLVVIVVYLGALLSVLMALNTKTATGACQWVLYASPHAIHGSWVATATTISVFTWAGSLGWVDEFGIAGTPQAAMAAILLLVLVAGAMAILRWEFLWSTVTAWAAAGIYRMQTGSDADAFPAEALSPGLANLAWWSSAAGLLFTAVGAGIVIYAGRASGAGHKLLPSA